MIWCLILYLSSNGLGRANDTTKLGHAHANQLSREVLAKKLIVNAYVFPGSTLDTALVASQPDHR